MDFSALTTFDEGTIVAGLLAIGAILAAVRWGKFGVRAVVSLIGR